MESGKRSSFDEMRIAASALRRFTRATTSHRLSLRRSATASTSSSSIKSFESEQKPPCVFETTRETLSDECALHRFIVWAAVKRNACSKMTAEERRECPLLRCRRRFPNHELLLQHLYDCKHLEFGEYWCYDCGKVETFHEMNKCRRCLGHPSKRKSLISLAKSILSSLGRPKSPTPSPANLEIEDSPPSYECLVLDGGPTGIHDEFELQSNEIHEIDSSEVPLPPIPEDKEAFQQDHLSRSSSMSSAYTTCTRSFSMSSRKSVTEEGQSPVNYESYINWSSPSPVQTVSPADLVKPDAAKATVKPALQVNTRAAFDQYRARLKRRSKNLQPSSSVRSTSSTNSTSSTASCNISPMSVWSGAWGDGIGIESALTSPADDVPNPDDVFPCPQPLSPHLEVDDMDLAFPHFVDGPNGLIGLTELPADIPMALDFVDARQTSESSGTPLMPPPPSETLHLESLRNQSKQSQRMVDDLKRCNQKQDSPHALILSVRETLDLHVSGSLDKLELLSRDGRNHVASKFCSMPANSVALIGLETMSEILQGQQVQSPSSILCFLHVVYSLSLVIHEQNATNWLTDSFNQAVSYCSWMSQADRFAYLQVVDFLWKPGDVTDEDFMSALQRCLSQPSITDSCKGKESASHIDHENDALLFISEYFLDEYAALRNTTEPGIQTSNLCTQHLKDDDLAEMQHSPFSDAANCLILSLAQLYHRAGGFVSGMDELLGRVDSNHICTVRRLELELLQYGKMQLPPDLYCDVYIKQVREEIDALQVRNGLQYPARLQYHKLGIELMASAMEDSAEVPDLDISLSESELPMPLDLSFDDFAPLQPGLPITGESLGSGLAVEPILADQQQWLSASATQSTSIPAPPRSRTPSTPGKASSSSKPDSDMCCEMCGYRPKGNPQWFHGSMAKHKKLMHANTPPKIYPCPFPGCNSQYRNRPDNLRQHQIEKGHFVDGQEGSTKSRKRRKMQ
ncbi:hypothetical protein NOR_02331 [Metarhizium rileyi]|uniref:C2H2-type domain-containing protein n=1 Tax=Metarhizium rileyi (strain RCEF 4871) TaxID=1649241 RepID=A0A167HF25_METRR|nr:hypothetical protein NOR_02331 [Metarhizium rileyi RCEF 4871]